MAKMAVCCDVDSAGVAERRPDLKILLVCVVVRISLWCFFCAMCEGYPTKTP
jgi:hypothetical protein